MGSATMRHGWLLSTALAGAVLAACSGSAPAPDVAEVAATSPETIATLGAADAAELTVGGIIEADGRFTILRDIAGSAETRIGGGEQPSWLEVWGWDGIGDGAAGVTIFAPTDEALRAVPGLVDALEELADDDAPASDDLLYEFLGRHYIVQQQLLRADFEDEVLRTWTDEAEIVAEPASFAGHAIVGEELVGTNGVVHVLSGVIVPDTLEERLTDAG